MITLTEACKILHVDQGVNDAMISDLCGAVPTYIETTTGLKVADQSAEPLCDVVSGFLLTQWYYADHADDQALSRVIGALLKAISVNARSAD